MERTRWTTKMDERSPETLEELGDLKKQKTQGILADYEEEFGDEELKKLEKKAIKRRKIKQAKRKAGFG